MTTTRDEQIDRAGLSRRAGHILFTQGPERPAATARETVILLDALAAAEHRIARLEAQSAIRGRAVVMYRERAREADQQLDHWMGRAYEAEARMIQAEARIKATLSVAQEWETKEVWPEIAPIMRAASARIRRALEG